MAKMKYCKTCIMPDTTEGASFDKAGNCKGCQAQNTKKNVDWQARKKDLDKILKKYKSKNSNYDCIIPISGGKDSVYQLHVICKEYGLKPLCVTFNHGGFTKTGLYNLHNALDQFNVDHVQLTLNNDLVKRIQKRSIETLGDYCWHCHNLVSTFTLQVAVMYNIPLIIWGESGAEYGHQGADYNKIVKFDKDYFKNLSSKLTPEEFKCEYITDRDLHLCNNPDSDFLDSVVGIHLGNYIPWDTEGQVKLIKKLYNWKGREVGGSYKDYKSIECSFEPMHEHLCLLKRGYARTSLQVSQEIREGKKTRKEGFDLVNRYERIIPRTLGYYLQRAGINPKKLRQWILPLKHEKTLNQEISLGKEWRNTAEDGKPFYERLIEEMRD